MLARKRRDGRSGQNHVENELGRRLPLFGACTNARGFCLRSGHFLMLLWNACHLASPTCSPKMQTILFAVNLGLLVNSMNIWTFGFNAGDSRA